MRVGEPPSLDVVLVIGPGFTLGSRRGTMRFAGRGRVHGLAIGVQGIHEGVDEGTPDGRQGFASRICVERPALPRAHRLCAPLRKRGEPASIPRLGSVPSGSPIRRLLSVRRVLWGKAVSDRSEVIQPSWPQSSQRAPRGALTKSVALCLSETWWPALGAAARAPFPTSARPPPTPSVGSRTRCSATARGGTPSTSARGAPGREDL